MTVEHETTVGVTVGDDFSPRAGTEMREPAEELRHPVLERVPEQPLARARLTDRQRLTLLLEGAALLAHVEHAGWYLPEGLESAGLAHGRLALAGARPGRSERLPQEELCALLERLFRVQGGILAGRGEARRAARALLDAWRQRLAPVPPDRAVADLLERAPFLWSPEFSEARASLVAVHGRAGRAEPWVAGPGPWRRRLLARASTRETLCALLADGAGRELWEPPRPAPEAELDRARELCARGHFERALAAVEALPDGDGAAVELTCLYQLGRWGAARRRLRDLARRDLPPAELIAAAEVAVRLAASAGDRKRAERWVRRLRRETQPGPPELAARAELVAAAAAWDAGDLAQVRRRLTAVAPGRHDPQVRWRFWHVSGLAALSSAAARAATLRFTRALRIARRRLARFEAAGLWNDLGVARGAAGDLAGAERAFLHTLRLFERCDGPRRDTLALQNLAEVRLRRGRVAGVREILARTRAQNRASGNPRGLIYDAALAARLDLVLGRPEAALAGCRDAWAELDRRRVDWHRPVLAVLAARAAGWLGRAGEAAGWLGRATPDDLTELEPEERPAVLALAGDLQGAAEAAAALTAPLATLWRQLLTGTAPPVPIWEAVVENLEHEGMRLARLVLDAEALAPGGCPPRLLRRAAALWRRFGAHAFAERLEARDLGPWHVLGGYLRDEVPLPALLERAGYDGVRLWWERGDERAEVLVDGPGGAEELAAPVHGGRLVLRAAAVDLVLETLFRLVARDFEPPEEPRPARTAAREILGGSPPLLAAVARLETLAPTTLPVLIGGESGTGKELAARHLHRASRRAGKPFVAVNCAALSETLILSDLFGHARGAFTGADRERAGVFETAQGGTVFLDEIGDLPPPAQGMLLRVLQEGEVRRLGESLPRRVDVRVVAATHRDLAEQVAAGPFRRDLFYRLKGALVALPPLRERGADVLLLADHFLTRLARPGGGRPVLSPPARALLTTHSWPGNIRELGHVLEAAAALAGDGPIAPEHLDLPRRAAPATEYHAAVEGFRRRLIRDALDAAGGNRSEAARRLGLTRQALSYLARKMSL